MNIHSLSNILRETSDEMAKVIMEEKNGICAVGRREERRSGRQKTKNCSRMDSTNRWDDGDAVGTQ